MTKYIDCRVKRSAVFGGTILAVLLNLEGMSTDQAYDIYAELVAALEGAGVL